MNLTLKQIEAVDRAIREALEDMGLELIKSQEFFGINQNTKNPDLLAA